MTDVFFTPKQLELQRKVKEFTEKHIIPVAREYDESGEYPEWVFKEAHKAGLNCLVIPEEYGGPGYDSLAVGLAVEEWGYGCAGFATGLSANGLASYPLAIAGTEKQKQLYYSRLVAGGKGCFALTEPGAGSDAGAVSTVAKLEGEEWVLNGTKCFATQGGYADIYVIFASTDLSKGAKGLSAFIVEREREGLAVGAVEHKMGIRASNTVELQLKNVRIPKDHLLGQEGEGMKIAIKTLDMARPIVAAMSVGVARRALDEAIKYVKTQLDAEGKSLAEHQSVGFKIADMATQIEAARLLVYHCLRLKDSGQPYSKEAAMAKMFATETAMKVTRDAVELMGSYGYSQDSIVEKLMRDAKITQIYEGTNQVQRIVISGQLLK